jgi:hypothetical protein
MGRQVDMPAAVNAAAAHLHELLHGGSHLGSRQVIGRQQDAVQVEPGLRYSNQCHDAVQHDV